MSHAGQARASWGRMAMVVSAVSCYVGAGRTALLTLFQRGPWDWEELLVHAGTWAVGMAVIAAVLTAVRRRNGDEEQGRAMVRNALATGELPEQPNPSAWRRALAEELREARHSRWFVAALMLLIAVLVAAAAAVDGSRAVWLLAVALAAFVVVPFRQLTRRAERAEDLLIRLASGRGEPPIGAEE